MGQTFVIDKAFSAGLRDDRRSPRNADVLATCGNARPTQWRLVPHEPITWPVQDVDIADVAAEWPCASLIRAKAMTLLARRNAIHVIDETTWNAGAAETLYNLENPQTESLANGDFDDGSDPLDDWTAGGSALNDGVPANGWTYSNANDNVAHAAAGGTTALLQAVADQTVALQDGHLYRVVFTITGMTAGSISAQVGTGGTGGAGTARAQNKMWTEDIVCDATGSADFELIPSDDFDGTITSVSVKEVKTGTIPNGSGPWQIADFQQVVFLANGTCLVAHLHLYGRWTWYVARTEAGVYPIIPQAICNFGNRLLLGGIPASTSYFSDDDWLDIWKAWLEREGQEDIMTYRDLVMGPNVLMYSDLSGGDFYDPFVPEMAMLGLPGQTEIDTLKYLYIDRIKAGAIGFIPIPWQGSIRAIRPLGNGFAVYGDNGVTGVVPQEKDGLAIYRTVELANVGMPSRGGAGGDHRIHAFRDNVGTAWTIGADFEVTRRGYSEFLAGLTDANVVVAFDPDQWDFHISDGSDGGTITKTGFGKSTRFPTHLSYTENGLLAAYAPAAAVDNDFEIITDTFDLGLRSVKTIKSVGVAATDVTNLKVSVEFKFTKVTTFNRTAEIVVTDEGFAFPIASGTDFRIRVTGTWGSNGKIDYIRVHWTQTDKRAAGGYLSGR